MGGNADESVEGKRHQSFVTSCCEGVHCAFVRFRVAWNCCLELKRGACPKLGYRSGAETLPCLAKGEKRSRIQQPSTNACIFLPVQVIQS
jgi:hypothetical protein